MRVSTSCELTVQLREPLAFSAGSSERTVGSRNMRIGPLPEFEASSGQPDEAASL